MPSRLSERTRSARASRRPTGQRVSGVPDHGGTGLCTTDWREWLPVAPAAPSSFFPGGQTQPSPRIGDAGNWLVAGISLIVVPEEREGWSRRTPGTCKCSCHEFRAVLNENTAWPAAAARNWRICAAARAQVSSSLTADRIGVARPPDRLTLSDVESLACPRRCPAVSARENQSPAHSEWSSDGRRRRCSIASDVRSGTPTPRRSHAGGRLALLCRDSSSTIPPLIKSMPRTSRPQDCPR